MYVRVAELRSFTEAARELHIAQSAVSRTIQELERQVGSSLLLRRGRTVELTPAGAELLPIARRLLNVYRTSMEDFGRFLAGEGGRVAVAALPSVAAAMLPTAIASFLLAHPRVHIDIQDGHLENVVRDTLSGRADFGITASVRLPRGVDARDLVSDRFAGLLPRNHPLCRRRSVTWKDLSCEPFIALSRDTGVRAYTDHAFVLIGATVDTFAECSNPATAAGLVAAGLGVSALPVLVHRVIDLAGLVSRRLVDPIVDRKLAIITRSGHALSPSAAAFATHLARIAPAITDGLKLSREV